MKPLAPPKATASLSAIRSWRDTPCHKRKFINKLVTRMEEALNAGEYYQAILALNLIDDAENGIKSTIVDGRYLRSLDPALGEPPEHPSHRRHYQIMGLGLILTLKKVLEIEGKFGVTQAAQLDDAAKRFIQLTSKDASPDMAHARVGQLHEGFALPLLGKTLGLDQQACVKRIKQARHFVPIEESPLIVCNHFKVAGQSLYYIETPKTTLTDTQRGWYERLEEEPFYKQQPEFTRRLIKAAAPKILQGHAIPTRMKTTLPGLRNAGLESLYIADENTPSLTAFHSGTHGLLVDGVDTTEYTAENYRQLSANSDYEHYHIDCLLSPDNGYDEDYDFHRNLTKAANALRSDKVTQPHYHFSTTPINFFRYFYWSHFTGHRKDDVYFRGFFEVAAIAQETLNNFRTKSEPEKIARLENALVRFERTLRKAAPIDLDNINLEITTQSRRLCQLINDAAGRNVIIQSDACKSGREREGLVRFFSIGDTIADRLGLRRRSQEVLGPLADMRFLQKQNGLHGGYYGAEGLKGTSKHALPATGGNIARRLFEPTSLHSKRYPASRLSTASYLGYCGLVVLAIILCPIGIGFFLLPHALRKLEINHAMRKNPYLPYLNPMKLPPFSSSGRSALPISPKPPSVSPRLASTPQAMFQVNAKAQNPSSTQTCPNRPK